MAYTTVQRPHGSSSLGELSAKKQNLVDAMGEFMKEGDRVNPTDQQLWLANELVKDGDHTRYTKIPFLNIIQANRDEGCEDMMATAFDVLFRYTVNMLKLKRPRNWHTIKFTNAQFKARADCMLGTRYILKEMGYTKEVLGDRGVLVGLAYPNPTQIDHNIIKLIAAELLTAKTEVKNGVHLGSLKRFNVHLGNPEPNMYDSIPLSSQPYQGGWQNSVQGSHHGFNPPPPGGHQFNHPPNQQSSYQPAFQQPSTLQPTSGQQYSQQPRDHTEPQSHFQPRDHTEPQSHFQPRDHTEPQSHFQPRDHTEPQSHFQSRDHASFNQQQPRDQAGYQPHYQHRDRSDFQYSYPVQEQSMHLVDLEPTSSSPLNTSDGASKLEELQKRKANIMKKMDDTSVPTQDFSNMSVSPNPVPVEPAVAVATSQAVQPANTPAKPVPRTKPRTKFLKVVEDDETKHPPMPIPKEDVPMSKPPVQKPRTRIMVECDHCGYLNHEKSIECIDCENPRSDRWTQVSMPGKPLPSQGPETLAQGGQTLPTTAPPAANTSSVSETANAVPNFHYGNQPTGAVNRTPVGQHGAAGTGASGSGGGVGIIAQGLLPKPKIYTPKEKEEMRREAEIARREIEMMEKHPQPQQHGNAGDGGLHNFMANNDNYNWGRTDGPTGDVLQGYNTAKTPNPDDTQLYKDLANQGSLTIQDIKDGLRRGYKLEEIRLAADLHHGQHGTSHFLSTEWHGYIERTKFRVGQLSDEEHKKRRMTGGIGQPQREELVQFLIETGGDCEKAAQKCCSNRLKMIQELMREVRLPQIEAVRALERNGLSLDRAIRDVYQKKISSTSLYEYIWAPLESGGIRQAQNDRVKQMITEKTHADHYLQRLLMAEYKLPMSNNCALLIQLVRECNLTLGACLDVAKMDVNIEDAKRLLTQECPVCGEIYTRNEMINMINCDHAVCQACFVGHFSIMVTEKSIKHCNCPVCGEPDMSSETIDLDLYLQMFSALLQNYMNKEQYDMFTKKVNERTMITDPSFLWCVKCSTGFINDLGRQKVECVNPECRQLMCFQCKKPWEAQHEGLTCDGFAQWKISNDPEQQAQGLAAYLNEEGIECPKCNFKYALAKGGCMHFKCTQCPSEFCSGCNEFFKKDCTKYESCRAKGFHAHHPRDCLFYLRDESVDVLQKLLTDNNIPFDIDPPEGQVEAEAKKEIQALEQVAKDDEDLAPPPMAVPVAAAPVLKCRVMLQKENPDGPPVDEECGNFVESGHAGLCQKHYKEYLVFKINQNRIDPLLILEVNQLEAILRRDEIKTPDRLNGEGDEDYKHRLQEKIVQDLPLKDRKVTKF